MMKIKVILKLVGASLVLAGLAFCSANVIRNRSRYDSAHDVIANVLFLFEDETQYAPGGASVICSLDAKEIRVGGPTREALAGAEEFANPPLQPTGSATD